METPPPQRALGAGSRVQLTLRDSLALLGVVTAAILSAAVLVIGMQRDLADLRAWCRGADRRLERIETHTGIASPFQTYPTNADPKGMPNGP